MIQGRNLEPHEIEQVLTKIGEFHKPTETLLEIAQEYGRLSTLNLGMEARSRLVNINSCVRSIAKQLGGNMTLAEATDEAGERFMSLD